MILSALKQTRLLILMIGFSLLFSTGLHAAKVTKVKGKKVYLKLKRSEAKKLKKGDKLWVYKKKKRKGLIVIRKVKGKKAWARIKKGKVKKSYIARSKKMKSKSRKMVAKNPKVKKNSKRQSPMPYKKWEWGTFAGVYALSMNIKLSSTETVAASGINLGWKGFLQLNLSPKWALQGVLGYQGFNSTGTANTALCNSTLDCKTDISFLAMEGLIKYYLTRNKKSWWAGFGGAMNFPLSKSSTALAETDIGLTNFFTAAGGVDLHRKNGKRIPVWFEYSMMPATATVNANYMGINVGWEF